MLAYKIIKHKTPGFADVQVNGEVIGVVQRTRWTSGSATLWKASGVGWAYTSSNHDTRESAARNMVSAWEQEIKK